MPAYSDLEGLFQRISALDEAAQILHWDMAVIMPPGGAPGRAEQLATLKVLSHELLTADGVADLFDAAESDSEVAGNEWRAANLREMHRVFAHATAVDGDLLAAASRAGSACEMAWREARPANDFASLVPMLDEIVNLTRQIGEAKAAALGCSVYEALLDQYEPGARTDRIDALFSDLAEFLPGFLDEVMERQAAGPDILPLPGPFAVADQRALSERMMHRLGFNFEAGRLDLSLHPFCGGVPGDVRITTRYDEADFAQGLMGVLHETGHALYEMGLPADWRNQPVGAARGMVMHESQSLLMEMQACRSAEFVSFATPVMREIFRGAGPAWEEDNIRRIYSRVSPGLIRVDADEVTYPAHVILRYRLERAVISGDLAVADIPGAWNEAMEELLGITPPDDRDGCLQDIHWFDGAWGYFPTYTMGALAAAQLFDAACRAVPEIPAAIAGGDFSPLMGWLRPNVHNQGSRLDTDGLLEAATGKKLGTGTFKRHLRRRYLG